MPAPYQVTIRPSARRELERLQLPVGARVRMAILGLAGNPRPAGALRLTGTASQTWRIRVGDYRVLYNIYDDRLVVLVIAVGHRREIYRGRHISEPDAPYGSVNVPQPAHGGRSWTSQLPSREVGLSSRA